MPSEESSLHRLTAFELLIVHNYRRCTPDRQDVILFFTEEMVKQSIQQIPQNVVHLKKP